jgi:hypothetical protein
MEIQEILLDRGFYTWGVIKRFAVIALLNRLKSVLLLIPSKSIRGYWHRRNLFIAAYNILNW